MSKYHANCTNTDPEAPKKIKKKCENQRSTSKPFCECQQCLCNNCPDILKMFSITVTENSCDFGSKDNKRDSTSEQNLGEISNLMDVLKNTEDCNCEIVARALRSNVHRNIGLSNRRDAVIPSKDPATSQNSNN